MQSFRHYHFQDIKVARVAKFHTLSFSGYQGYEGCRGCKISDFIILSIPGSQRVAKGPKFDTYHFQDIKVTNVTKGAEFHTLSFSGYQGCEGWKVSGLIIFRLQSFRLHHSQDIKVVRVAKVARIQTSSFLGYQGCDGSKGCKVSDFIILKISRLPR